MSILKGKQINNLSQRGIVQRGLFLLFFFIFIREIYKLYYEPIFRLNERRIYYEEKVLYDSRREGCI